MPLSAQSSKRVLFLGGGGNSSTHNADSLSRFFMPVIRNNGMTVEYKTNESILNSDSLKRYDVMFIYNSKKGSSGTGGDNSPNLTTAQENALYAWVDSGHVIVGVHCANSSYLSNPRFLQLFGADYTVHGDTAAYRFITIVNPSHPSMTGVGAPPAAGDNTYWDEGREGQFTKNDTVMLARARTNTGAQEPWTWVRPEGKGWVYYTSSGHDIRSWKDANLQKQWIQALIWGGSVSSITGIHRRQASFSDVEISNTKIRMRTRGAHSLCITDMAGRTVFSRNDSFAPSYDLSTLAAGAYGVKIVSDGKGIFHERRLTKP
jgi:uncharacterized protein